MIRVTVDSLFSMWVLLAFTTHLPKEEKKEKKLLIFRLQAKVKLFGPHLTQIYYFKGSVNSQIIMNLIFSKLILAIFIRGPESDKGMIFCSVTRCNSNTHLHK